MTIVAYIVALIGGTSAVVVDISATGTMAVTVVVCTTVDVGTCKKLQQNSEAEFSSKTLIITATSEHRFVDGRARAGSGTRAKKARRVRREIEVVGELESFIFSAR